MMIHYFFKEAAQQVDEADGCFFKQREHLEN